MSRFGFVVGASHSGASLLLFVVVVVVCCTSSSMGDSASVSMSLRNLEASKGSVQDLVVLKSVKKMEVVKCRSRGKYRR